MRATAINLLRSTLVSVEMVVIFCGLAVLLWKPDWVSIVGTRVAANSDLLKYLVVVPVAVFVWVFSHSRKMLFPESDKKKVFQNWPDYQRFKEVVLVGIVFSLMFSLVGVVTWAMNWNPSPSLPFVLISCSIIGSFVTAFTMHQAEITLNETFNQLTDKREQDVDSNA